VALAGILGVAFLHQERVTFESDPGLRNGSLESWTRVAGGRTLPEHFAYEGTGEVKRTIDPADVRSGTSALLMDVPTTGEARLRYALPDVPSYRGREVRLTLWSRSQKTRPSSARASSRTATADRRR
jgi:hypothetical protein